MFNQLDEFPLSELSKVIDFLQTSMDDFLYIFDLINDTYYISPSAMDRFALPDYQFDNATEVHKLFVHADDFASLQEDLELIKSGQSKNHNLQYRWLDKNKNSVWINCRGSVIDDNDGHPAYLIGCINEIGNKQKADNVSGLLGLTELQNFIANEFTLKNQYGFILQLGLDDFKEINEKLGSDYGDMLLGNTANCIKSCLKDNQHLYRLSGDEFIIIDSAGRSKKQAIELYKDIRCAIDSLVENTRFEAIFTLSGGVLPLPQGNQYSFSDKMKFAAFSLSEAKRKGKNCTYTFSMDDYSKFLRRRSITQQLRQSINNNFTGFEIYLQPLYNTSANKIFGAECLLRFSCEELGNVPPYEMIPILEDNGLIIPVGKWVLHESLRLQKEIQKSIPDFLISINVSYIQIIKSNIISDIITSVEEFGINPDTVVVELTESGMLVSDLRLSKLWKRLQNKGIHLALDDFGTGYSNFHYLNELKPDIIKIDRSFTVQALQDEYEEKLLYLMGDMVHSLDIKMCIEGIEEQQEMDRLAYIKPTYYQGYYFGKPCPFDEFVEKYVKKQDC